MSKTNTVIIPNLCMLLLIGWAAILMTACQPAFECTDAIGCVDIAPGEPVEIGVIQDLSGSNSTHGTLQVEAIELAFALRGDTLLGHPVKLRVEDEGCTPEGGANAALSIVIRSQVVAIIGASCSGAAVPASEIMSEAGLVMVSGLSGAPSLTAISGVRGANWQSGFFRTSSNNTKMFQLGATFAFHELGVTKIAILNDGTPYSREYVQVFANTITNLGGEVVLSVQINPGDTDMKPVSAAIASSGPELIYFPLYLPDAINFVQQVKQTIGLEDIIFWGNSSVNSSDFQEALGTDSIGIYSVNVSPLSNPAYDQFVAAYEARYNKPLHLTSAPYGYDAAHLLISAIETAAVQDDDGTLHIGRQALRDVLYATTGFDGLTGNLTCDEFGDCGAANYSVFRLEEAADGVEANIVYSYSKEK